MGTRHRLDESLTKESLQKSLTGTGLSSIDPSRFSIDGSGNIIVSDASQSQNSSSAPASKKTSTTSTA